MIDRNVQSQQGLRYGEIKFSTRTALRILIVVTSTASSSHIIDLNNGTRDVMIDFLQIVTISFKNASFVSSKFQQE
jgi:hypothetical protein